MLSENPHKVNLLVALSTSQNNRTTFGTVIFLMLEKP